MSDWEHRELENKISQLERRIDDLGYELRRAKDNLDSDIRQKADKHHEHGEG